MNVAVVKERKKKTDVQYLHRVCQEIKVTWNPICLSVKDCFHSNFIIYLQNALNPQEQNSKYLNQIQHSLIQRFEAGWERNNPEDIYKKKIWQTKTSDGCNYNRRRLRFVNIFDFEPALLRANKVSFTRKISIEASQPARSRQWNAYPTLDNWRERKEQKLKIEKQSHQSQSAPTENFTVKAKIT